MIVEKYLIGQTVIFPYMEDTDSDILRLGFRVFNNFVINVDIEPSSRLPSLRYQMINQSINYFICRHKCITMGTCNTEIHRLCYKQPYSKYRNSMIIKITHSHTIDVSSASGF